MKLTVASRKQFQSASALVITLIMGAVALAILAAALAWQSSNTRLTYGAIQYDQTVAAAEAATEKVIGYMTQDFLNGGESLVVNNLNFYRTQTVPSTTDSAYWTTWFFDDGAGDTGQTYVQRQGTAQYVSLDPIYGGLNAFVSTYTIVSHASNSASIQAVNPGVYQQVQLATIPIFQFAMYSSGEMEISCGQPFDVTGRVFANGILYVEPDSSLTFESSVEAVVSNIFGRDPLDTRGPPVGSVVYVQPELELSPVGALNLPIGTNNTPTAVREIIEPPPPGESPSSQLGQLRYYNQCDMVVTVDNSGVTVTSGSFNNFATVVPPAEAQLFISTNNTSFYDWRESKTVLPIDIDIGQMTSWSLTNSDLRMSLLGSNLTSVYVVDKRTLPGSDLGAVRVYDGKQLPPSGLTVATGRPLYVQGDYNELNDVNLGTTNTANTRPASLVADAITVLSDGWSDANSVNNLSSRLALKTTVNAALLTGVVETTYGNYSGGMENFPRFLETWGTTPFTYNGSMVKMFPSLYATNSWGHANVYKPPVRNWAFDVNFNDPTKLPPKTPGLQTVIRSQWATVPSGTNNPPPSP